MRICKAFQCVLKTFLFIAKKHFDGFLPEKVPEVKRFRKFSTEFNKKSLKCKFIIKASYFENALVFKILVFSQNKLFFYVRFFFNIFVLRQHISSSSTNEMSNERIRYILTIRAREKQITVFKENKR